MFVCMYRRGQRFKYTYICICGERERERKRERERERLKQRDNGGQKRFFSILKEF